MSEDALWDERYKWLDKRLTILLREKPWLMQKLQEPNGVSWVVIEYWRKYEKNILTDPSHNMNPTNPETIIRRLRRMRLTKETFMQSTLEQSL
jgi:hypothetical protein